jgi:hypothetical protein
MLGKTEYYRSVPMSSFEEGHKLVYEANKHRFDVTKLGATGIIPWTKENFPGIFDEVNAIGSARGQRVARCRFFVTPKNFKLNVHTDGHLMDIDAYALNIPIVFAEDNHFMNWFTYDGELKTETSDTYANSISPAKPEELVLAAKLTLTTPHYVKIGIFHSVDNPVDKERIILSIRFTDSFPLTKLEYEQNNKRTQ